jgi:Ca2+-binding EF-hand superfamily protein
MQTRQRFLTVEVDVSAGLAKLFKSIDADGSGTITVEELKKALQDWGHRIHDVSTAAGLMLTTA